MTDAIPNPVPRQRLLTPWQHRIACTGTILMAGTLGGAVAVAYNALSRPVEQWPYEVIERRLITPDVPAGGYLIMRRVIDYHDDCDIRYERRVQSQAPNGRRFIPPDIDFDHPPWDRSGKPQEFSIQLPVNFTCGSAYLVESVSAACNLAQRYIRRLRKPDIITPFNVPCGEASPG